MNFNGCRKPTVTIPHLSKSDGDGTAGRLCAGTTPQEPLQSRLRTISPDAASPLTGKDVGGGPQTSVSGLWGEYVKQPKINTGNVYHGKTRKRNRDSHFKALVIQRSGYGVKHQTVSEGQSGNHAGDRG